jgi:hypothetical protein
MEPPYCPFRIKEMKALPSTANTITTPTTTGALSSPNQSMNAMSTFGRPSPKYTPPYSGVPMM